MNYKTVFSGVLLVALSLIAESTFGQGTDLGTIRGTVTDSAGGVIVAASITITDALTKTDRITQTNSQGNYEMFGLNPGTYSVTVAAPGMSRTEIRNIVLSGTENLGCAGKCCCYDGIGGY
jgi:hypothetical protein